MTSSAIAPHQRQEALQRLVAGETQANVARTSVDPIVFAGVIDPVGGSTTIGAAPFHPDDGKIGNVADIAMPSTEALCGR